MCGRRRRRDGVSHCIIDTPPHAESSILDAMRVADLVLVPTRPGPFDLAAVAATIDLARSAHRSETRDMSGNHGEEQRQMALRHEKAIGKAPLAVLNHSPPQTGLSEPTIVSEAREAVRLMGADVAATGHIATRRAVSCW